MDPEDYCYAALILAIGILMSVLFALAGEPSSVWFWRDVVGKLNV